MPYVVSGGMLGLGLVFLGGFLYFGAWLAKMGTEQRESAQRLADTMLVLADSSRARARSRRRGPTRRGRAVGHPRTAPLWCSPVPGRPSTAGTAR